MPSADAVKTRAKTGSTTGAIVIAALFVAIAGAALTLARRKADRRVR